MSERDRYDAEDEAWLLARERGEERAPPAPDRPVVYARIAALIAEMSPADKPTAIRAPQGWERRALAAIDAEERSRPAARKRRLVLAAVAVGVLAAAAVAVILIAPDHRVRSPMLALEFRAGGELNRGGPAAVGDVLIVRGELPEAGELRLYREPDGLVARCPGDEGCRVQSRGTGRSMVMEVRLAAPGHYRAVLFAGSPLPPPTGSLEGDLAAATAAPGVTAVTKPLEVR